MNFFIQSIAVQKFISDLKMRGGGYNPLLL